MLLEVFMERQGEILSDLVARQNGWPAGFQSTPLGHRLGIECLHGFLSFLQPRLQAGALPLGMGFTLHHQLPLVPDYGGWGVRISPRTRDRQAEALTHRRFVGRLIGQANLLHAHRRLPYPPAQILGRRAGHRQRRQVNSPLRLDVGAYVGTGQGFTGGNSYVTANKYLSNTPVSFIDNIKGAYTGITYGSSGFRLTYSLEIQNYANIRSGTSSVTVRYTMVDN